MTFSSPVTLTPGATYIASYHTNVGHYSNTGNYFTTNVTSGPLTAPCQRQRRLHLQQQQRVPDKHLSGDELLG